MRRVTVAAAALVLGLPLTAYQLAPAPATAGEGAPGSALGGYNTAAVSTAVRMELLAPGLVPLGDSAKGNFIQLSLPYAAANTTTGPASTGTASPAWPGEVVATAGSTFGTFVPQIPAPITALLSYPAVAYSSYPARSTAPGSATYSPPAAGAAGVGTASSTSVMTGTQAKAAISDFAPLGDGKRPSAASGVDAVTAALKLLLTSRLGNNKYARAVQDSPLLQIASASSSSSGTTKAASVVASGASRVGRISLLGVINIDNIASDAQASSDGTLGKQSSDLNVGSVTVAGQAASITPEGITLNGSSPDGAPNPSSANAILQALKQAGMSITLIAPEGKVEGANASVSSGAIHVEFFDDNLPNLGALVPQAPLPLPSALGLDLTIGASTASAAATAVPSFGDGGSGGGLGGGVLPGELGLDGGVSPRVDGGSITTDGSGTSGDGTTGSGGTTGGGQAANGQSFDPASAAALMGVPVRTAWVVLALMLALMGAGLMLGYANWQLLRGRTT